MKKEVFYTYRAIIESGEIGTPEVMYQIVHVEIISFFIFKKRTTTYISKPFKYEENALKFLIELTEKQININR